MEPEEKSKKTWDKINQWEVELEILKTIIDKTDLVETNKWGGIVYTYNNKNIIGIGGFKNFFTIWFFNGVFLKDDLNVLVNANEGVTKALRQWRFNSKSEINEKQVLKYIKEAIENEKLGLSRKPERKPELVSTFLENEFKSNNILNEAFQKLSLSKRNEFTEYIELPKKDETKLARIQKIIPMILSGIGLNDKYKK